MYSIFYGPRRKKADISLSVNTIVIVVLAITILGLGLNFIRTTVGGSLTKIGDVIDTADLDKKPTSFEPITIDEKVSITRNGDVTKKIGFYNKGDSQLSNVKPVITNCISISSVEDISETDRPTIVVNPKSALPPSESAAWSATIKIGALTAGKYSCVLSISTDSDAIMPEKDFTLEVTV